MAVDRRDANLDMIRKAEEQQAATKETVFRIDRQLAETEEIGSQTLEELRKQGSQMEDISSDLDKVSNKLDQSANLQSTFDKWAGNWWGGKKKDAMKEAAAEIASRDMEALSKVKEVFEHENYTSMSRSWKPVGKFLRVSLNPMGTAIAYAVIYISILTSSPIHSPSATFHRICPLQCPHPART